MRRLLPALLVTIALSAGGCGSSGGKATTSAATSAKTSPATSASTPATAKPAPGGCKPVAQQKRVHRTAKKPTKTLSPAKTHVVTLKTNCGDLEITLDAKLYPKTASSFASLVTQGFYDGLGVVRTVPDFVVQIGDPNGDGTGGPGYSVVEPPGNNAAYRKGVIAMAKTGAEAPGTSGSQFFIVTGVDAGLPPEYAIAGKVTKGLKVLDLIGAIPPTGGDPSPPVKPVTIEKATLVSR